MRSMAQVNEDMVGRGDTAPGDESSRPPIQYIAGVCIVLPDQWWTQMNSSRATEAFLDAVTFVRVPVEGGMQESCFYTSLVQVALLSVPPPNAIMFAQSFFPFFCSSCVLVVAGLAAINCHYQNLSRFS